MAYYLTLTYRFDNEQMKKIQERYKINPDNYGCDFDYKEDLYDCLENFSGKKCDKYGTLIDTDIDDYKEI